MKLENIELQNNITLHDSDALVVVDIQNDFLPGGALEAPNGDAIIPNVNKTMEVFNHKNLPIVFTQDWHPKGHYSFASSHEGKNPFDPYEDRGLGPVLWPDHCVQGSKGAEFATDLNTHFAEAIIRKGYRKKIDSYSGFVENDFKTETGLDGYLKSRGVNRIFVCGLTFDYCAYFTAVDGRDKNYEVVLLTDLTEPVGAPEGSIERARDDMKHRGVKFTELSAIETGTEV